MIVSIGSAVQWKIGTFEGWIGDGFVSRWTVNRHYHPEYELILHYLILLLALCR